MTEKIFIFSEDLRNFNEIFRKDVTYDVFLGKPQGGVNNVFAFFIFNCKFIFIKKKKKKIGDFQAANKVIITNYSYTNFAKVICG